MCNLPKGNAVSVCHGDGQDCLVQSLPLGRMESQTQPGGDMQALVDSHAFVRSIDLRDLFRSAYMRRFGKDISTTSLDEDVGVFKKYGKVPPYVIDLMIAIYGVS